MKVAALDHLHIYSQSPEESASFYTQHLGGREMFRNHNADGGTRIFLLLGKQMLVIGDYPLERTSSNSTDRNQSMPQHRMGVDHFGLRVRNLEAAVKELRQAGVQILAEPVQGSSGISYAFISTPDHVIIELTQYGWLPILYIGIQRRWHAILNLFF